MKISKLLIRLKMLKETIKKRIMKMIINMKMKKKQKKILKLKLMEIKLIFLTRTNLEKKEFIKYNTYLEIN